MRDYHHILMFGLLALVSSLPVLAQKPAQTEIVMSPGMRITVTTSIGTISITAIDELTRAYTWEGATRAVEMGRRQERGGGNPRLSYPGPGDHWEPHNGITRGVLEEGQEHFQTLDRALVFLRSQKYVPCVYRDDGLVVGWGKELSRRQLMVNVWQIYIRGKKPQKLPGSSNDKIQVTSVETEQSALVQAVQKNDLPATRALLQQGEDSNVKNSIGNPVLTLSIRRGYTAITQALLGKGADPNTRDHEGTPALLGAASYGNLTLVKALLAKGADVNAAHNRGLMAGVTSLTIATVGGSKDIIHVLLEAGASVKAEDNQGNTALHWAAQMGHLQVAEMLVKRGAEVDARNWGGMTPLMYAAVGEHLEMAKFLIAKGANVNARDDATRRDYGFAGFVGDTEAQKRILKSSKLLKREETGNSVLDWAKIRAQSRGKNDVIALLKKAGAKE